MRTCCGLDIKECNEKLAAAKPSCHVASSNPIAKDPTSKRNAHDQRKKSKTNSRGKRVTRTSTDKALLKPR